MATLPSSLNNILIQQRQTLKICFVLAGSQKWGADRSFIETLEVLKERGVECFVLLPHDGELSSELSIRGIPCCVIPYKWWIRDQKAALWNRFRRTVLHLVKAVPVAAKIRQWNCNVIYTNTTSICVGAFAAALLRLPHVWHIREFVYEDHGQVFDLGENLSLKLMDKLSSVCIVNSKAVAQKYQQFITPSKVKVIYQAVSVNLGNPSLIMTPTANFNCLVVGRLGEGKRQEDAIRAVGVLVQMGIAVKLDVVGKGDQKYEQYLRAIVKENKLEEYVTFVGYVENPFPLMQSADVLLVCSRCEAFGRVTVEGMRAGKPVIGTKSGGTEELIQDGFNGFLYPVGDYKDLAQKIRHLYEHPAEAKQMGENGQLWAAKHFTQAVYGAEISKLLTSLVEAASS